MGFWETNAREKRAFHYDKKTLYIYQKGRTEKLHAKRGVSVRSPKNRFHDITYEQFCDCTLGHFYKTKNLITFNGFKQHCSFSSSFKTTRYCNPTRSVRTFTTCITVLYPNRKANSIFLVRWPVAHCFHYWLRNAAAFRAVC